MNLIKAYEGLFDPGTSAYDSDRKEFVKNLGWLLSQTRANIKSCELDDAEIVTVTYQNGSIKKIYVECDSYMAIVRDVTKNL